MNDTPRSDTLNKQKNLEESEKNHMIYWLAKND